MTVNEELLKDDYHENIQYESLKLCEYNLHRHTFENCHFSACHFNEMSLDHVSFCSCVFQNSEFLLTRVENCTLNSVKFLNCKIAGLNFSECNKFGFLPEFDHCRVESSVFCANNLKKTFFVNCLIKNTDFTACDLRETDFSGTRFEKTVFQKCNLEKTDFRTALNYEIDPFDNKMKNARFTLPEAQSFLGYLGLKIEG